MTVAAADIAIVGAGVCGLLVADALTRAGRRVCLVERGGHHTHAEQLATGAYAPDVPTAAMNHESAPGTRDHPWNYVYGVGGSTLAWAGVAPRFDPTDFSLASSFGVGRDWPIGYDDLVPFYERAEGALGVAGDGTGQPPHPPAPVDALIAPHLAPYAILPQARPTRAIDGRPACSAIAQCHLCPSDARFSGLHTLAHGGLGGRENLTLLENTIVSRVRVTGGRATALECISAGGERMEVRAGTIVLAANALENPALLLRSGVDGPDVGAWLGDHEHRIAEVRLDLTAGHGYGETPATGISYALAGPERRAERGALLMLPVNPGIEVTTELGAALARGERGPALRERLRERFRRTLVLDTVGEDLPRADRRMELSANRDRFGLPLNRVHYGPDSEYLEAAYRALPAELEQRLEPLGARVERVFTRAAGAHLLGTCRMGASDGVVDPDLRHHRIANLYVAGGSAFPTHSAAHPTLTIAALAIRLGDHLAVAT